MTTLVIGYGNELRGDDGAGPALARAVAGLELPGVEVLVSHGLTPELAGPIGRAARVVFVDARAGAGGVEVTELSPGPAARLGHAAEPRWLLALAGAVAGRAPRAWLVTVPASSFGYGEGLSGPTAGAMAEALGRVRVLAG